MATLLTVTKLATEAGLAFLVIGGNAVIAHGYQRGTKDVDLLVRDADLPAWNDLVRGLGYSEYFMSGSFQMYNDPAEVLAPLDLLIVGDETFLKMTTHPETVMLEGATIQIPRLSHLIALKLHAIRQNPTKRYARDMGDIVELLSVNGINLEMPEFRAIFDRYATAAIRAEVERRLAGPRPADS
jgi:predicted nucleotidyltransferase